MLGVDRSGIELIIYSYRSAQRLYIRTVEASELKVARLGEFARALLSSIHLTVNYQWLILQHSRGEIVVRSLVAGSSPNPGRTNATV